MIITGFISGFFGAFFFGYVERFFDRHGKKIEIHKITKKKGRKPKIISHDDQTLYKKEIGEIQ